MAKQDATEKQEDQPNAETEAEQAALDDEVTSTETSEPGSDEDSDRGFRFWMLAGIGGSIGLCIALFVVAVTVGVASGRWASVADLIAIVRDLFIILLVLELILVGVALIVMILQLSALMNILQNEVKPILESTQQAANTVRGTSDFMSKHVTKPVIRSMAYFSGMRIFLREVRMIRKSTQPTRKTGEAPVVSEATPSSVSQAQQGESKSHG
ncbi:MAG: hypothetical protein GYB66_13380 [Chloroflexi bacterium]|nr:hypothetical protein [Chloroflexota bacterium]